MVVHALKSLTVLAGLSSCFPETWDNDLILHLASLSLTGGALKCDLDLFEIVSTEYPGSK